MNFDFSKPITFYEFLALMLSTIAVLIPVLKCLWNKFMVTSDLYYYPNGQIDLYFNQSGSYVRIDGVYEVKNKNIIFRESKLHIKREINNDCLNLSWLTLISPVSHMGVNGFVQMNEISHSFSVNEGTVIPVFVEYGDPFCTANKAIVKSLDVLRNKVIEFQNNNVPYLDAYKMYCELREFVEAKDIILREFYWKIGEYSVDIVTGYNDSVKTFNFKFSVTEDEYYRLKNNIEETILIPLKLAYYQNHNFYISKIELRKP